MINYLRIYFHALKSHLTIVSHVRVMSESKERVIVTLYY